MTTIKCKKNLYNGGLCFTKGNEYTTNIVCRNQSDLLDANAINDQGQRHGIGGWYKEFKIVEQ
jgi:hypothetical protein